MTTKRRTAAAVPALAIATLAFFAGGCGAEPNQAACERAYDHFATCASPTGQVPPEFDLFVSLFCTTVPETSECHDWSAFADCVSSISCTELLTSGSQAAEACQTIAIELQNDGCMPASPGF